MYTYVQHIRMCFLELPAKDLRMTHFQHSSFQHSSFPSFLTTSGQTWSLIGPGVITRGAAWSDKCMVLVCVCVRVCV